MLVGKELGAAISEAIRKKGISKSECARHFGVTPGAITNWIDTGRINKSRLTDLFEFFKDAVPPEHWGLAPSSPMLPRPSPDTDVQPDMPLIPLTLRPVPVMGRARGGEGDNYFEEVFAVGDADGYVMFPTNDPSAYGVHIVGGSMDPRYRHGEIVIVSPNVIPATGDDVLVRFLDGRRMCKRLVDITDGWIRLESINSAFRPLLIEINELEPEGGLLLIVGRAPRRLFMSNHNGI